jgi:hypothetical protein
MTGCYSADFCYSPLLFRPAKQHGPLDNRVAHHFSSQTLSGSGQLATRAVEYFAGSHEVKGSIPFGSTNYPTLCCFIVTILWQIG